MYADAISFNLESYLKDMSTDIRNDAKERLTLLKEVYVQTQNWARHNETLIIATNTVLLGATAAICANYFKAKADYAPDLFWLPLVLACVGLVTTVYLSRQYKLAITRVVVYEKYFKLHAQFKDEFNDIENIVKEYSTPCAPWIKTFVPEYLNKPPKFGAASSWFFLFVHLAILVICAIKLFY